MDKKALASKKIKDLDSQKLPKDEINKYIDMFEFWGIDENDHLITSFEMTNFKEALLLLNMVAELADEEGHHPDLTIYDYKNVYVSFCTHDAGGLTLKDFSMAAKIEKIFEEKSEE